MPAHEASKNLALPNASHDRRGGEGPGDRGRGHPRASHAHPMRLARRPVECAERDRDRYGCIVAVCRVGGEDMNAWMVAQGWAVAYRKYFRDYLSQESAAKAQGSGLWRGEFVPPSRWRCGERLQAAARNDSGDCRIKGNISRSGTRTYHVPGGQ